MLKTFLWTMAVTGTLQAALIGDYRFNGDLSNSAGGTPLTGVNNFSVGAGTATFDQSGPNSGFQVSGLLPDPATYTIALRFEFDLVSSYRKIIDFSNLGSDSGLYINGAQLRLYSHAGTTGSIIPDVMHDVVITRSGGFVNAYIKASSSGTWSGPLAIDDSAAQYALFSPNVMSFFLDDATAGERSSGTVDRIMVFDSPVEIESIDLGAEVSAVPEPGAVSLVGLGLAAAFLGRRAVVRRG